MPTQMEFDSAHNAIVMRFRGIVTADEMQSVDGATEQFIASARPGLHIFTDLTGLERMDLECVPHLTRFMDRCMQAGVKAIVRVIPDPDKDIGFTLLSLTHYRGRVPIITVATVEEAKAHVEKHWRQK